MMKFTGIFYPRDTSAVAVGLCLCDMLGFPAKFLWVGKFSKLNFHA